MKDINQITKNRDFSDSIKNALTCLGFRVQKDSKNLKGLSEKNICNSGKRKKGVQLELSEGLRKTFFQSLESKSGRMERTERFNDFVLGVRTAISGSSRG